MTPAPRPIHRETEPLWCSAFRREHELVRRLLEAKNAGLLPGVPRSSGLWCERGRYYFGAAMPMHREHLGPTMGLAAIEALLSGLEIRGEAVA